MNHLLEKLLEELRAMRVLMEKDLALRELQAGATARRDELAEKFFSTMIGMAQYGPFSPPKPGRTE